MPPTTGTGLAMPGTHDQDVLTLKEVCKRLRLSDDTIRRRVKEKRLKTLPRTKHEPLQFSAQEIAQYMAKGTRKVKHSIPADVPDLVSAPTV